MALSVVSMDPKRKAKDVAIDAAKAILEMAEDGRLVDLTWCASTADGGILTGMTATEDAHRRLSAITRLQYRCLQHMDEDSE